MTAAQAKFYCNDIAYRKLRGNKIRFGVIKETGESLNAEEEDDHEKINLLKKSCVNISWIPNGTLNLIHEGNLVLYDRFLQKGSTVRRIGGNSQLGRCLDIDLKVSARVLNTDKFIPNVKDDDLLPLADLCVYDTVMYRNWIGVIKKVERDIVVETGDNGVFLMNDAQMLELEDVYENRQKDPLDHRKMFVGQVLSGSSALFVNVPKSGMSLNMKEVLKHDDSKLIVQIKSINVFAVEVDWYWYLYCVPEYNPDAEPSKRLQLDDLPHIVKLNKYRLVNKYQGAYSNYRIKSDDPLLILPKWLKHVKADVTSTGANKSTKGNVHQIYEYTMDVDPTCDNPKPASSEPDVIASSHNNTNMINPVPHNPKNSLLRKNKFSLPRSPKEKKGNGGSVAFQEAPGKRKISTKKNESSKKRRRISNVNEDSILFPISFKSGEMVAVEIILCNTKANVLWQDGTIQYGVCSRELVPLSHVDENEYFPNDFVVETSTISTNKIYGCVKMFNHAKRTAMVTWVHHSLKEGDNEVITETFETEECSVYSIKKHPEYKFYPGTFVIRALNNVRPRFANVGTIVEIKHPFQISVNWLNGEDELMSPEELLLVDNAGAIEYLDSGRSSENDSSSSISSSSISSFSPSSSLSPSTSESVYESLFSLKNIVEKPLIKISEMLEHFGNNPSNHTASDFFKLIECGMHCQNFGKLFVESLTIFSNIYEDVWKKVLLELTITDMHKIEEIYNIICHSLGTISELQIEKKSEIEAILNDYDNDFKPIDDRASNLSAMQLALKISEEFCGAHYLSTEDPIACHKLCAVFEQQLHKYDRSKENMDIFVDGFTTHMRRLSQTLEKNPYPLGIVNDVSEIFSISDNAPITHHYIKHHYCHSSIFTKVLQKEFKILKTSLPPGIYLKGFQDRMDLFSLMIKGPKHTPYEDGLFLFDLQLTQNYPLTPPKVFYISFCAAKLNPNLYEEGKVCLSLLGTWDGEGTERWVPAESNLFQLFVSIQSLILVAEPYYNEAGYEKQVGSYQGIENSRLYNEMAVLKTIESIIAMIERPTEVFGSEILQHFKRVGPALLKRCYDYAALTEDSELSENASKPGFPLLPISMGFCIALTNLLDKLEKLINTIE